MGCESSTDTRVIAAADRLGQTLRVLATEATRMAVKTQKKANRSVVYDDRLGGGLICSSFFLKFIAWLVVGSSHESSARDDVRRRTDA